MPPVIDPSVGGSPMLAVVVIALLLGLIWHWLRGRRLHNELIQSLRDQQRLEADNDSLSNQVHRRKHRLQQFALMLSQMRDGVLLIGADGNLIRVNQAARRMLHLRLEKKQKPVRYGDVLRYPPLRDAINETMRGQSPTRFELELKHKGRVSYLEGSVAKFDQQHADDEAPEPLMVLEDPEESKIFEVGNQDDHQANNLGLQATRLLVLIRDQSERFEMEAMRRDLTANLSHELKTPLAAIKGYAETIDLAIEDDVDAARHFMSQLHDQCRRMENLIADMLHLTRVQSQVGQLQITRVNLEPVFETAIEAAKILAAQKETQIVLESFDSVEIFSDREALLTILNNLIGNAVHYTQRGGRVGAGVKFDRDRGTMTIHVEDNGVGISAEDQPKIFNRFYRVQKIGRADRRQRAGLDGSGPSERSGTGLGLSIVQTLTEALGGSVSIQSELGRGSRFEVTLPIRQNAAKLASSKLHGIRSTPGVQSPAPSRTISS